MTRPESDLVRRLARYKGQFVVDPASQCVRHPTRTDAAGAPACPLVVLCADEAGVDAFNWDETAFSTHLAVPLTAVLSVMEAADHLSGDPDPLRDQLLEACT